jgi:hypothetical protein
MLLSYAADPSDAAFRVCDVRPRAALHAMPDMFAVRNATVSAQPRCARKRHAERRPFVI